MVTLSAIGSATNLLSLKFVSSSRISRNETGDCFCLAASALWPPPRCAARHAAALPDAAGTFGKAERAGAGDRARAGNTATAERQNSKQSRADYGHGSGAGLQSAVECRRDSKT